MIKKTTTLLCIGLLLLCGCGLRSTSDQRAVQPGVRNIQSPSLGIPLYFYYKHLPYLGVELRDIQSTQEQSIEQLALGELIAGPRGNELQRLIPEGTTVQTNAVGSTLFVTLSQEFLDTLPGESRRWTGNQLERAKVLGRRRLAVYSIVNTVTEIGNFSRVQILIADPSNPQGYRPSQYDMGLSAQDDGKVLDILVRQPGVILTPEALTRELLSSLQEKQWEAVYNNISQAGSQSLTPVTVYEFEANAKESGMTLESFSVDTTSVTFTGSNSAIVLVSYTLRNAENHASEYTGIPFRLTLTGNIWKAEYDSVQSIIEKGTAS